MQQYELNAYYEQIKVFDMYQSQYDEYILWTLDILNKMNALRIIIKTHITRDVMQIHTVNK